MSSGEIALTEAYLYYELIRHLRFEAHSVDNPYRVLSSKRCIVMLLPQPERAGPRVAIVSDTMVQSGGAERVVEAIAEAFPDAPVFAVLYDPARGPRSIATRVSESWLRRIPNATKLAKVLIPLYPNAIESFDLRGYDVIISSHHTLAKGILRSADQTHICYCHTPARSLWELPHDEIRRAPALLRPLVKQMLHGLRNWDFDTASRVDKFIANSAITSDRIAVHYRRESSILHPPIDTDHFTPGGTVGDYYLISGRNVPYKRIDLAIEAAKQLGRRLVVTGDGTDKLADANSNVTYYGKVSDEKLMTLMREARALLFPQHEDFGMTVLEMNACGRPVIAFGKGGALETVADGKTGVLFPEQTVESLADAILRFEQLEFDPIAIRMHAERFSKASFTESLKAIVSRASAKRLLIPRPQRQAGAGRRHTDIIPPDQLADAGRRYTDRVRLEQSAGFGRRQTDAVWAGRSADSEPYTG
jgi:glycosyltransferase involved in cell wall biosynthesis